MRKVLVIVLVFSFSLGLSYAQEDTCHAPRFLPGTVARVIGSLDAGGLAYRSDTELDRSVEGFYPIGTVLKTISGEACVDGRVWYGVKPLRTEVDYYQKWVTDGDENSYWLEPLGFCVDNGGHLDTWRFLGGDVNEITYDSENNHLLIGVSNPSVTGNSPFLLNWYSMNLETAEYSPSEDPYAEIITPELTEILGISDYIFGDAPAPQQMLFVSPDRLKIVYFKVGERAESPCAHGCQHLEMFSANADGSNSTHLMDTFADVPIVNIVWGANNRIYPTFIPEVGPVYFTMEVCLDGTCARGLGDALLEYGVPEELATDTARASVSPNGRYLAVTLNYQPQAFVVDIQTGNLEMLPDKGGVSLPPIWSSNRSLFMGIDYETLSESSETLRFNHDAIIEKNLSFETGETGGRGYTVVHDRIFEYEVPTEWLISMNPPRAVVLGSIGGVGIYCLGLG